MSEEEIRELRIRIARLENDVAALTRSLGGQPSLPPRPQHQPARPMTMPASVSQKTPVPQGAVMQAPLVPPPSPAPQPMSGSAEADFVGTWAARLGVVALLIGAGFGYRYAVEQGLIGPALRVFLGLVVGGALIGYSEVARTKGWRTFSQAIAAGGVAMLTLSIWAASQRYDLLDPSIAFALLGVITAGGVWLAIHHDSQALAYLAAFGGFLNPVLVGTDAATPAAIFGYILLLDAGLLTLAMSRSWPALGYQAFAGTWLLFGSKIDEGPEDTVFMFATLVFALFALAPMLRAMFTRRTTAAAEVPLQALNALAFLGVGLEMLGPSREGGFAFLVGVVLLAFAGVARAAAPHESLLPRVHMLAGFALLTIAVPLQYDGVTVPIVWALEALIIMGVGYAMNADVVIMSGVGVLGLSVATSMLETFQGGEAYDPDHLVASPEAATFALQLLVAGAGVFIVRLRPALRPFSSWIAGSANVLALVWLTWEASAHVDRTVADRQAEQFAWSAVWTLYAAGMLAIGVALSIRWARLLAVSIIGFVLLKAVTVDLWMLRTGHRVIAFLGLGVILLASSLMYNKFRALIIGEEEAEREPNRT